MAQTPGEDVEAEFLTPREVASLMRVAEQTVRTLCTKGEIAGARKFGGSWRIHRRTFLASLAMRAES